MERNDDVAHALELWAEADRIARRHPGTDRENVYHTLLLLDMEPIERLRIALQRSRKVNIRLRDD